MPVDYSLTAARAGVSLPLTNLAQGFTQSSFVMRLLYPLVEVGTYGGTTLQFDESAYEPATDDRADDTPYPEVQSNYEGKPFKLNTKGLSYRVGDKRRKEMENLRINWGQIATTTLMTKAGLNHEIEGAIKATTLANYATTNRLTLAPGSRFGDVNPDPIIRSAISSISDQISDVTNLVGVMGRRVFDVLAGKYATNFTSTSPGVQQQLTLDTLANIYGFRKLGICDAIAKVGGVKTKVFGNDFVIGVANPAAIPTGSSDAGLPIPYVTNGTVNAMTAAFGYTYVMQNQPRMYAPWEDLERRALVYQLDFDRAVVNTGVNTAGEITHGFLIKSAV